MKKKKTVLILSLLIGFIFILGCGSQPKDMAYYKEHPEQAKAKIAAAAKKINELTEDLIKGGSPEVFEKEVLKLELDPDLKMAQDAINELERAEVKNANQGHQVMGKYLKEQGIDTSEGDAALYKSLNKKRN